MTLENERSENFSRIRNLPLKKSIISYEILWQALFIFVSVVSAVLINKLYLYQTLPHFQQIRKGNVKELFLYGIPCGIIFIAVETLIHKFLDTQIQKTFISHERYKDPEIRRQRCYKLGKWAFSIVYYGFTSIFGYVIVKDTSFMPTWLGGHGYCTDLTRYIYSLDEVTTQMKYFYILQFGKHLFRLIQHCFFKLEGNFYEYALHHGLSSFLIFFFLPYEHVADWNLRSADP